MNYMHPLSEEYLHEIRLRHEKSTKGIWKSWVEGRDHTSGDSVITRGDEQNGWYDDLYLCSGASVEDQDFIAHAHQDIPRLLEEIVRLKSIIFQLEPKIDQDID